MRHLRLFWLILCGFLAPLAAFGQQGAAPVKLFNQSGNAGYGCFAGEPETTGPNAGKVCAATTSQAPVEKTIALTVGGAAVAPGRSFAVNASAAGNVSVTFSGGSTGTYPVQIGLTVFPFAITQVTASSATATYENWK